MKRNTKTTAKNHRANQTPRSRQNRRTILKSVLAILLAILIVGSALAPVFTEDGENGNKDTDRRSGTTIKLQTNDYKLSEKDIFTLNQILNIIKSTYKEEITDEQLVENMFKGVLEKYDRHSTYLNPEELQDFMRTDVEGIGVYVSTENAKYIEVKAVIPGSPALAAGVKQGDRIYTVDGKTVFQLGRTGALNAIRGKSGTKVKIGVKRGTAQFTFTITRARIKIDPVEYKILQDGTGYIKILEFARETDRIFDAAIANFRKKGVKNLVVDLRSNPGGYLSSAVHISQFFLDRGDTIVNILYKDHMEKTVSKTDGNEFSAAILINKYSASASEILAGAAKSYRKAVIIGENSYGKGTVQTMAPMVSSSGMSAVKITTAEYYLRSQVKVDGIGIKPDIEVEDDQEAKGDKVLEKALEVLNR